MTTEPPTSIMDKTLQLIANAELTFGIASGNGGGAFLLALVVVVFLFRPPTTLQNLSRIVRAWRTRD
ncbi:hypothetical protein XMM379_000982 [Aliiroseovarius sp. xm-m-379]|nr:hypothetical protein [Aliiroseovarius sp. xm-d-517]NRP24301.1 hypothetical protein [Aliiroseovarius sp. xm-m-379]NRP29887.1 hypothetical protein [Aliiroseovarius sp. xm-m-314]NRP33100.1 hypothetical protein [Aliiroseovarius sp. xm-a-104]NRP39898.1 hypothetical protein [Aliiroseovarius sp. xm-m-339-2]NRP43400.1 hypothetical protein [Aliiroseovarius sp. xm-m-378]NRP49455.1 hypothetical protein [Aliiroseovarius sp. xm-m-354]NRP60904.1 hypothetical protein [Aliiroseovarius sp. xm-a-151]NRP64